MKKNIGHPVIYETDNIEHAKEIMKNGGSVSVRYKNPQKEIPPTLTMIIEGNAYTKYNPEYVKYLKEIYPGINEEEIISHIEQITNKNQEDKQSNNKTR